MTSSSTLVLASVRKNEDGSVKITRYRDFTPKDTEDYRQHVRAYAEARERFKLLHIVGRNFTEFRKAIDAHVMDMIELDRLLLNFLASCYALRHHLDRFVKRKFGHNSTEAVRLKTLIDELTAKNASFKFFQEARNCAQHAEMLIDNVAVHDSDTGKKLSLSSNVERLRKLDRQGDWSFADSDTVDLITAAQEYHDLVITKFGKELIELFGEPVFHAHNHCESLYQETKCTDAQTFAVVIHQDVKTNFPGYEQRNMSFEVVPKNIFEELGLHCSPREETAPSQ